MKKNIAVFAAVLTAVALSGCTATKANMSGDARDEGTPLTGGIIDGDGARLSGEDEGVAQSPDFSDQTGDARESDGLSPDDPRLNDPDLQQRLIYFEFDKSVVSSDQLGVIEAHARFLIENPHRAVLLEGHADERGSNEYNLALGQRRANAVRDILMANGVDPFDMETISFGEERPRVHASNEAAWAENRRVEIRYRDE